MVNINLRNIIAAPARMLIATCAVVLFLTCNLQVYASTTHIYTDHVIFTAPSAVKIYDGTPLTEQIDVTAQGLPKGFTFKAIAEGSVTSPKDNAPNNNVVTDYVIYDPSGLNVTDKFVNVELRPGTLEVRYSKGSVLGAKRKNDSGKGSSDENTGDTVVIEDEETAKSGSITDSQYEQKIEIVIYGCLFGLMVAAFILFIVDSRKEREQ